MIIQTAQVMSLLLGSLVGAILALTGAGGAIIAVPLLIFGLHLAVAEAAPVALFAVGISAAIGALLALRSGKLRYRAAIFMALTGALASPMGIGVAQRLPNTLLMLLLAAVMAFVAFRAFWQSMREETAEGKQASAPATPCQLDSVTGRLIWTGPCAGSLAISGIATGFLSGLLGVGGGFIIVPSLRAATNLASPSVVSTSLAVVAFISTVGALTAGISGGMNWSIAVPFTSGAVFAMLLVSAFAHRIKGRRLQQAFAVLAAYISAAVIVRAVAGMVS